MSIVLKQEEYYSTDAIVARLSGALGSDDWENLKKTDLGQALLTFAANAVNYDAQAFFLGVNQLLRSTVTQAGYLEEIAKSKGVIPKTYVSANLTLVLRSNTNNKTYLPMDFSIEIGGKKFYNISDITILTTPTTVVLYEGGVIREASQAGTMSGNLWSYTKFKAPQSEKIGDKVVRRYLLLPRETFTDSILVESNANFTGSFTRWTETVSWYSITETGRNWKLAKDFLGRYSIEFGDGVYGRIYPIDEIVGVRYLLSSGSGVTITNFSSYKLRYQDVTDVTTLFAVTSVSNLVDGQSEVNMSDLKLEIERKENTREALIKEDDYKNYLEGRADVLCAAVRAERHVNPPNLEYFNTVTYAIKANTELGNFNDAIIQGDFARIGLDTVEFKNIAVKRNKFNVKLYFDTLPGYVVASVQAEVIDILEDEFTWENLGFNEILSESRIYNLIKDVEGIDLDTLDITVEAVYTNETTGVIVFDFSISEIIDIKFYPKRFRLYIDAGEFYTGTYAKDNGLGSVYGDIEDAEKFNFTNTNPSSCSLVFGNLMLIGNGSSDKLFCIDLRKSEGGVNQIDFGSGLVNAITWCDRYNEIITLETDTGLKLRAYKFPETFFDQDSFSYIQIQDVYEYEGYEHTLSVTPPTDYTTVAAIQYFDSYIYVIWVKAGGATGLFRYRITQSGIEDYDTTYEVVLDAKIYKNIAVAENVYSLGKNALYICADLVGAESGIDVVIDFDIVDEAVFEKDFLGASISAVYTGINWLGISSDGTNIYGAATTIETTTTVLIKLYSITEVGDCDVKQISDDSVEEMTCALYDLYAAVPKVYTYDASTFKIYYVGHDTVEGTPVDRAGTTTGSVTSITKVASIKYDMLKLEFIIGLTNATLYYEAEDDLTYEDEEMAIVNLIEIL